LIAALSGKILPFAARLGIKVHPQRLPSQIADARARPDQKESFDR